MTLISNKFILLLKRKSKFFLKIIFYFILIQQSSFYLSAKENKIVSDSMLTNNNNFIAHGGGHINGLIQSNSYEAVQNSISKGYYYIELDLNMSLDNEIVFLSSWDYFKKITNHNYEKNKPLSYDQYLKTKISDKYNVLTIEKINKILDSHKDLNFIFDKFNNFKMIKNKFSDINRLHIEIFGIKNYIIASYYNFPNKIFNTNLDILDKLLIKVFNIKNIAISTRDIEKNQDYLQELIKNKGNVYAFTSNDKNFIEKNLYKSFTKIYTDYWNPIIGNCEFNDKCTTY